MKTLAVLIVLTALGLFGSAFFGIYTAPGLEGLPTVESLGAKKNEKETDVSEKEEQPKGIFPVNSNGAATKRGDQIRNSGL